MLTNGNLVIKCNKGTIWSSDTANKGVVDGLHFQNDGNVVLRSINGSIVQSAELKGDVIIMQNDGNLVLYATGNVPVWNSETTRKCGGRKGYS